MPPLELNPFSKPPITSPPLLSGGGHALMDETEGDEKKLQYTQGGMMDNQHSLMVASTDFPSEIVTSRPTRIVTQSNNNYANLLELTH